MLIKIRDGAQEIGTQDCRILNAPDNILCAVWRGLAFPLRAPGDVIDVSDEAFAPATCRAEHEERSMSGWTVTQGETELYVLLVGSWETLVRVTLTLTQAGADVLRTGRYLGEAAEADWFVRLARPRDVDVPALLTKCLGSPTRNRAIDLRAEVLGVEVAAARDREAQARSEGDRLRRYLDARHSASLSELEGLRRDLETERAARMEAESSSVEAKERVDQALESGLVGPGVRTRSTKLVEREIETVLAALLPRARLLRDTLTVVAVEFADRRGVYSALGELQASERGVPKGWKTLQGVDGWIERHVSNGLDDSGRSYARFDPTDRSWQVLVSHKGQQTRDIAWLARR